jgi:hypothetical protein
MNKIYKNASDFLTEFFPMSYPVGKNDNVSSLQSYIEKSSEQFNKAIKEIIRGNRTSPHSQKKSLQA